MAAPWFIWGLAWIATAVLLGIVVAEVWIRLRDGYANDPIDLDALDRPMLGARGPWSDGTDTYRVETRMRRAVPNPPHVSEELAQAMAEIRREPLTDEDAREMQQALTRLARKQGRPAPF